VKQGNCVTNNYHACGCEYAQEGQNQSDTPYVKPFSQDSFRIPTVRYYVYMEQSPVTEGDGRLMKDRGITDSLNVIRNNSIIRAISWRERDRNMEKRTI